MMQLEVIGYLFIYLFRHGTLRGSDPVLVFTWLSDKNAPSSW